MPGFSEELIGLRILINMLIWHISWYTTYDCNTMRITKLSITGLGFWPKPGALGLAPEAGCLKVRFDCIY